MNDIMAVVVLYNENLYSSVSFISLMQAVTYAGLTQLHLLVYDNSPQPQTRHEHSTHPFIIHYKSDTGNGGISKAYNYAAGFAKEQGFINWLLFLDQDTSLPQHILLQYQNSMAAHPALHLFVPILTLQNHIIFSPCRYLFKRGFPLKKITPGIYTFEKYSPVNSGMLVQLTSFFEAGGYKNEVRLDFSDFQFIERFKKKNSFFCVIDAMCVQQFSNEEINIGKLNTRYKLFCESAKNTDKANWLDECIYFCVVIMRATTLSLRTRKIIFYKTFLQEYVKKNL